MQENCQDIQFMGKDNQTLTFYLECCCNTKRTQFWVLSDVSYPTDFLYVGYGNNEVSSSSLSYSGFFLVFSGSTPCETNGWSRHTDSYAKYIRGGTYGDVGGSSGHRHTISGTFATYSALSYSIEYEKDLTESYGQVADYMHSHTYNPYVYYVSHFQAYQSLYLCYSTEFSYLPDSAVIMAEDDLSSTYSSDWSFYSTMSDKFPKSYSSASYSGGIGDHSHHFYGYFDYTEGTPVYCRYDSSADYVVGFIHRHYLGGTNTYSYTDSKTVYPPFIILPYFISTKSALVNTFPYPVEGMIIGCNGIVPPLGWDKYETLDGNFPYGSTSSSYKYLVSQGSEAHSHTWSFDLQTVYGSSNLYHCAEDTSSSQYGSIVNHRHYDSHETTSEDSHLPPYFSIQFIKRRTPSDSFEITNVGEEQVNYWMCFDVSSLEVDKVCDGVGDCIGADVCNCSIPFYGEKCNEKITKAAFGDEEHSFLIIDYKVRISVLQEQGITSMDMNCSIVVQNTSEVGSTGCEWQTKYIETSHLIIRLDRKTSSIRVGDILKLKAITTEEKIVSLQIEEYAKESESIMIQILKNTWWVVLVLGFLCCCCCYCCCCCASCCCCMLVKQTKRIKKFKELEDFDLILQEQMAGQDSSIAHLNINKELFEIDYDEVHLIKKLSDENKTGSGSVVYLAEWESGGKKKVAFKVMNTALLKEGSEGFNQFQNELRLISSLFHPNILKFYGASTKGSRIGILMEYCPNGDLENYIRGHPQEVSYTDKLRMLHEISSAMLFLHSKDIIHRDLKCQNVLLDSTLNCKVMDFGISTSRNGNSSSLKMAGTSQYMAPEVTLGEKYDEKCDVFSFGIMMFEILTENFEPYKGLIDEGKSISLEIAENPRLRPRIRLEEVGKDKFWFISLMKSCFLHVSDDRPSFSHIEHEFSKCLVKDEDENSDEDLDIEEEENNKRSRKKKQSKRSYNKKSTKKQSKRGGKDEGNMKRKTKEDLLYEIEKMNQRKKLLKDRLSNIQNEIVLVEEDIQSIESGNPSTRLLSTNSSTSSGRIGSNKNALSFRSKLSTSSSSSGGIHDSLKVFQNPPNSFSSSIRGDSLKLERDDKPLLPPKRKANNVVIVEQSRKAPPQPPARPERTSFQMEVGKKKEAPPPPPNRSSIQPKTEKKKEAPPPPGRSPTIQPKFEKKKEAPPPPSRSSFQLKVGKKKEAPPPPSRLSTNSSSKKEMPPPIPSQRSSLLKKASPPPIPSSSSSKPFSQRLSMKNSPPPSPSRPSFSMNSPPVPPSRTSMKSFTTKKNSPPPPVPSRPSFVSESKDMKGSNKQAPPPPPSRTSIHSFTKDKKNAPPPIPSRSSFMSETKEQRKSAHPPPVPNRKRF